MANKIGKAYIEISATADKLVNEVGRARQSLSLLETAAIRMQNILIGVGTYQVLGGIRNAIDNYAEFDRTLKQVEVITGATGTALEALNKSTIQLGTSTQFSAKNVAELQLQLGRLGFSTSEIINSTKAIVDLATATGEDLAKSAQITGSILRAFQMDAREMGHVTDVMASALNESALSVDTFGEAMKYVAPVAKSANVSLEELSAMMAVLADAGFSASTMGTSLRRIITMLGKDGGNTADKLKQLAAAGITLADANDEVGLYAQSALLQITAMIPKVEELTKQFTIADGSTRKMAEAMQDNLATAIDKVGSAWDAWIYSLKNGENVVGSTVSHLANLLTVMSMTKEEQDKLNIGGLNAAAEGLIMWARPESAEYFADKLRKLREQETESLKQQAQQEEKNLQTGYKRYGMASMLVTSQEQFVQKQQEEILNNQKTLDLLKKQREEYDKKYKAALEFSEIARRNQEDALYFQRLNPTMDLSQSPQSLQFTPSGEAGDMSDTSLQEWFATLEQNLPLLEAYDAGMQELTNSLINAKYKTEAMRDMWISFGETVANQLDNVIAKNKSFGQSMAELAGRVIDSNREMILSNIKLGLSNIFAKYPIAAPVIASLALAGISGLLKKAGRTSDDNVRVSNAYSSGSGYSRMQDSGTTTTVIRGQDLYVTMSNYQRNRGFTVNG